MEVLPCQALHNLSLDIASRVDLNTDLNVQHTVTFDVTNYNSLTALELIVTTGTNQTLTLPVRDGVQSQTVTLAGIDTTSAGTVTFQLSGTHAGGTTTSNVYTVNIANVQSHEFAYVYTQSVITAGTKTLSDSDVQSFDVTQAGSNFTVTETVADNDYFVVEYPANRPITGHYIPVWAAGRSCHVP